MVFFFGLLWVIVLVIGTSITIIGLNFTFSTSKKLDLPDWGFRKRFVCFLIACGGISILVLQISKQYCLPVARFTEIGRNNQSIVLDWLNEEKVSGVTIRVVDASKVRIVYTTNPRCFNLYVYAFGWRQYRDINEDVAEVIGQRDGIVYFLSKSTGKVKTMPETILTAKKAKK